MTRHAKFSGKSLPLARALTLVLLPLLAACSRPAPPRAAPRRAVDPAAQQALMQERGGQLFEQNGCIACHGPDGQYREKLAAAAGKPEDELVRWILTPQSIKPGTEMPDYEGTLSREDARVLAVWVKRYAASRP